MAELVSRGIELRGYVDQQVQAAVARSDNLIFEVMAKLVVFATKAGKTFNRADELFGEQRAYANVLRASFSGIQPQPEESARRMLEVDANFNAHEAKGA